MRRLFIMTRGSLAAKYGVGTYIQQLVDCFDKTKWRVAVVEVYSLVSEFIEEEKEGIVYYQIPFKMSGGNSGDGEQSSSYYRSIFYFLKAQILPEDSVFCHFNFVYEYELAILLKEKLHAKIVLTMHYMDWSFDMLGDREWLIHILRSPKNEKDKWVIRRFEAEREFILNCCDRVIAIAKHSYQTLLTLYGIPESKLVYIPNALKDEYIERTEDEKKQLRKKYGFDEQERLIIFAGRFNLVKGINELIEAFKLVLKEIPDCRLILAGDEGVLGCFKTAAPCWSRIVFTGFVPREQLYELYAIADVGIVPSIHEEFGYVAVEMMMNNLPLIVSDTTGLREISGDGKFAWLIGMERKENRVTQIKEGLLSWFSVHNFVQHGRERFKAEYDSKRLKQEIDLLYHSIINDKMKSYEKIKQD